MQSEAAVFWGLQMIVKKIKSGKLKPPNLVEHGKKLQMQLLANVSGAFRPGILTCLFGVSGDFPSPCLTAVTGSPCPCLMGRSCRCSW